MIEFKWKLAKVDGSLKGRTTHPIFFLEISIFLLKIIEMWPLSPKIDRATWTIFQFVMGHEAF